MFTELQRELLTDLIQKRIEEIKTNSTLQAKEQAAMIQSYQKIIIEITQMDKFWQKREEQKAKQLKDKINKTRTSIQGESSSV